MKAIGSAPFSTNQNTAFIEMAKKQHQDTGGKMADPIFSVVPKCDEDEKTGGQRINIGEYFPKKDINNEGATKH